MPPAPARQKNREKVVNPECVAQALAKAVCDGDIVCFRFLFSPFSPARRDSTERFETEKYAYLRPSEEELGDPAFRQAITMVREPDTWRHIQQELEANRPARMPANLLLLLADQAVRSGKYTSAAQAYEVLRIRGRMQQLFFDEADAALACGDIARAVRGYVIATGLAYNYAAFPEPLPAVPDFQTRALILHGEYAERPEDCVALQDVAVFLRTALGYLLLDAEAAARLEPYPLEVRVQFLVELVRQRDPRWDDFARRYVEACHLMQELGHRIRADQETRTGGEPTLADEIAAPHKEEIRGIPERLLGRGIDGGEWWQYLKELAYEHPAAALFVARYAIGATEILAPRYRADSPVPAALRLTRAEGVQGSASSAELHG